MSQVTVRSVEPRLRAALDQEARRRGLSLNRTVLALLREGTGLVPDTGGEVEYHDLDHLAGTWSEEEQRELDEAVQAQRRVDEALWR